MGKGSKDCKVTSHQFLKDKAKNRVEDLQWMLADLQSARKESRNSDVVILEEQVNQILCEWKAELDEPTPASSFIEDSLGSEIMRLLRPCEEQDDATSAVAEPATMTGGPVVHGHSVADAAASKQEYGLNRMQVLHQFQDQCNSSFPTFQDIMVNNAVDASNRVHSDLDITDCNNELLFTLPCMYNCGLDGVHDVSDVPDFHPSPSAFLGPKCPLWDCSRPAQGSECCKDYCSTFHAELAMKEGPPGTAPVLRPGGIGLKDGPLFAALRAKIQAKDVGIPECEGAATAKSPWNAPELFDISMLDGEKMREWLFFDKPRRAFETGNRKQRSLPDHNGRGWHESRKQIMKEYDGQKRSYYADPQPHDNYEWHLFEYEIDNCNVCALYHLELKLVDEKKKSPKGKLMNDSLADLQKRLGRLTATPPESKRSGKGRTKGNLKPEHGQALLLSNKSSEPSVHGSACTSECHPGEGSKDSFGT